MGNIHSISYTQRFVRIGHSFCHELCSGKANSMPVSRVNPQCILQGPAEIPDDLVTQL